ncbi:MAG: hemagglutinin repeat-containing protein, partial [Achromobacter piechaudii]
MQSGGDMTLRAQGMRLAGAALSDGAMTLDAAGDLRVDGSTLAYGGALTATGGNDLTLGAESQAQGKGVALAAGHDMRADGVLASTGDASMQAGGNVSVNGSVGVDGNLAMQAGGSMDLGAESQVEAAGRATLLAQDNLVAAGAVRSNDGTSLDAGRDLTLQGIAAAMRGALKLKAGRNAVLAATSQALAGGDADVNAGGNLNLAGKVSSLSDVLLQAGQDMTLNGQLLAARNLRAQAGQVLTSGADAQIQADGDINATSGAGVTLAGQWAAGKSIALEAKGAVLADAKMLAAEGGIKLGGLGDITLGNASELQAKTLLAVQAGGKLQAMGTLSSEGNINLSAQKNLSLEGTTVAGQQLQATAGATLDVTRSGLAQGSNGLRFSGQDIHIAGTAGTADTALAAGGTLDVQASRDLTVADSGIVSAGSSASLGAQRHLGVDGVVSALDGNLAMQAGGNLNVGQQGRLQAGTELTARADGDLVSRGTVVSGADMALYAGNDLALDGVVGALGQRGSGNLVLDAGRDAYVAKG